MERLLIGNIVMLLASILMIVVGCLKEKKKIIIWQTIEIAVAAVGYVILGSFGSAINMTIGGTRNILYFNGKLTLKAKILLILAYIMLSLCCKAIGILEIMLLCGAVCALFIIDIENIIIYKLLTIVYMIIWAVNDFCVQSYIAFVFDIGTIIAIFISIWKIKSRNKVEKEKMTSPHT